MAMPSAPHAPAKPQAPTPGIGTQGFAPGEGPPLLAGLLPAVPTIDPASAAEIDKVVLHRLYPEADSVADAQAMAVAQGKKTAAEGAKVIAAQNEPPEFVR